MPKYWIAVASREHVQGGVKGGFCQVCHGKQAPLKRMKPGDWIIYYSPTIIYGEKSPCKSFTAIGQIAKGEPYQFKMNDNFIPYRRDVKFLNSKDSHIEPLLNQLTFTKNKKNWGFIFMRGIFEICFEDFKIIAENMGIKVND